MRRIVGLTWSKTMTDRNFGSIKVHKLFSYKPKKIYANISSKDVEKATQEFLKHGGEIKILDQRTGKSIHKETTDRNNMVDYFFEDMYRINEDY